VQAALRVLLVEDGRADAMITRAMLAQAGQRNRETYDVVHVEDFATALQALGEGRAPFDLVLLDLGLPDASGVGLVVELEKRWPGLAVIVLSGAEGEDVDEESLARGAQEFLRKGQVSPDAIARAIRASLVRASLRRELNASEREHRALFDLSPSPIWVVEPQSLRIVRANAAAVRLHGHAPDKLATLRFPELQPEEAEEALRGLLRDREKMPQRIWRQRTSDGRPLRVHLHAAEIADAVVLTAQDVSAWYHSLEAMRASDRRSRALFDLSAGLLCEHDLEGKLMAVNTAAAAVLGSRPDQLAGRSLREFMPADDAPRLAQYLQEIGDRGEAEGTFTIQTTQGPRQLRFRSRLHESLERRTVIAYASDAPAA